MADVDRVRAPEGADAPLRGRPPRSTAARLPIAGGLLATLVLLLAHSHLYEFQTDDAYISFRYARNLSRGQGLVFNPGHERVEGYTNLMWVLCLAAGDRLGLPPERAANGLSLAATVALWGLVVWFAGRRRGARGLDWIALVPALLLAATRSVAVWSTSGLETRLFEVVTLGGVLRLAIETESRLRGSPRRWPAAALLFGFAALTRPDGILLAVTCLAAAAVILGVRRRLDLRRFAVELVPFAILVGGHLAFRLAYYGAWLPNTYYAKVGGVARWDFGFWYLAAFLLEYAAFLWIPLLVAAGRYHARRGTLAIPILFASAVLPHALYVAAVGGDHFEYRPLDLYFPLVFLLLADGLRAAARRPALNWASAAYLGLILAGLVEVPYRSHREFPSRYINGFPGSAAAREFGSSRFLRPEEDPLYRWPGLRRLARAHRTQLDSLSTHFVGLRQEEHRLFLATVVPEGKRLRTLIERGVVPREAHFAVGSVGAIPYYSDLRTLDRLGLTDFHVAHSPFRGEGILAHDKLATAQYARDIGVDFWAMDAVHILYHVSKPSFLPNIRVNAQRRDPVFAADVGEGYYMFGMLPQGFEAASRRFPRLRFRSIYDAELVEELIAEATTALRDTLRVHPDDQESRLALANALRLSGNSSGALALLDEVARALPTSFRVWMGRSVCREELGDYAGAIAAAEQAAKLARQQGRSAVARDLEDRVRYLSDAQAKAAEAEPRARRSAETPPAALQH